MTTHVFTCDHIDRAYCSACGSLYVRYAFMAARPHILPEIKYQQSQDRCNWVAYTASLFRPEPGLYTLLSLGSRQIKRRNDTDSVMMVGAVVNTLFRLFITMSWFLLEPLMRSPIERAQSKLPDCGKNKSMEGLPLVRNVLSKKW